LELGNGAGFARGIQLSYIFFLFHFLKERTKVYKQNGTKVITEEDPILAVVIVTP
jgi:hypothetical protein